ncbi:MAG: hypothetical protein ONB16_08655 [candidate division KSB1 bacterium]|nr:hypothetical protein [candidate division KSB1 bacterium]MDZ7341495.1 hypothetical protein [candidate division KSB1 bacterium]
MGELTGRGFAPREFIVHPTTLDRYGRMLAAIEVIDGSKLLAMAAINYSF